MNKFTLNKNEDGRFEIHQSDIRTWKRCRRKAQWSSRHGKSLQPKKDQTALWMGLGIHKALELYYEEELDPVWVWNKWCEFEKEWIEEHSRSFSSDDDEIEEQQELGEGMLEYYKEYSKDDEFEVIDTEVEFQVPIPTPKGNKSQCDFVGRVDGIARDKYDRLWVLEHKTFSNNSTDHLKFNEQASYYTWAMQQELGEEFAGLKYNILLKQVPERPSVNKSGSISKRKKKSLTTELYRDTLLKNDEDPNEYQDMLDWISKNSYDFVKRKDVRRNDRELAVTQKQLYQTYRDMHNSEVYPNFEKSCNWSCSFEDPCLLKQEGRDPTKTLDRKFEVRDTNNKEEEFEEYLEKELALNTVVEESQDMGLYNF